MTIICETLFPAIDASLNAIQQPDRPFLMAFTGSPGCGKTTLAYQYQAYCYSQYRQNVVVLSLDDYYKTQAQRQRLSQQQHPLWVHRGVPGTHDIQRLIKDCERLKQATTSSFTVPRFSKLQDDQLPPEQWRELNTPIDGIVLEGWCLGATAQLAEELIKPVNELEAQHDGDGVWRRAVNEYLVGKYALLFNAIDLYVHIKAPSFSEVCLMREHQDRALFRKTGKRGLMPNEVVEFMQLFERIDRHMTRCFSRPLTLSLECNRYYQYRLIC